MNKKLKITFNSPIVLGFAAVCLVAVLYIGQQIVQGITLNDNVSNMAHIIGGIVGGALGYGLNKKE